MLLAVPCRLSPLAASTWHALPVSGMISRRPVCSVGLDRTGEYTHEINLVASIDESLGLLFHDSRPVRVPDAQEAIEQTFVASLGIALLSGS